MPCSIKDNVDLEKNYNGTGVENNLWKFADDETTSVRVIRIRNMHKSTYAGSMIAISIWLPFLKF